MDIKYEFRTRYVCLLHDDGISGLARACRTNQSFIYWFAVSIQGTLANHDFIKHAMDIDTTWCISNMLNLYTPLKNVPGHSQWTKHNEVWTSIKYVKGIPSGNNQLQQHHTNYNRSLALIERVGTEYYVTVTHGVL